MVKADHFNYKYALAKLTQTHPNKTNKKRKSKGHKPLPRAEWTENDLNSLLGTNWTELLQYLSKTNILLHTNPFSSCLEARLTILAASSGRMNPRNKDQRRAWPLSLLNYIPCPFPDTVFSDTDNIHEQATEELIFRDIWFQLFMTGNAVETATLGCLLNKIINQFNTATQFRMQLFDEVMLNLPAPYASNVQWTGLPEGTKELLRCNYCALQLLGTAHALETAISQLTHKIDEVLVLMNLE